MGRIRCGLNNISLTDNNSSHLTRNHFQQSYTLQVQWILEAVFARLGVRHQARNFGNGGLGTIHNGLAAGSIYGPDVDFLMWDSGMTEREGEAMDAFARQAIFGSRKVPVLWSLPPQVSSFLHDQADVDVGVAGTGFAGLTELTNIEDINKIPWAAQYVRCSGELWNVCRDNEYIGKSLVDPESICLSDFPLSPGMKRELLGRSRGLRTTHSTRSTYRSSKVASW